MSKHFTSSSAQFGATGTWTPAYPITIACWFRQDVSINKTMVSISDNAFPSGNFLALYETNTGNVVTSHIRADAYDGTTQSPADGTTVLATGVWYHAVGVWANTTFRSVYLNGAQEGRDVTPVTPTGLNTTSIANIIRPTPIFYFDGDLAEIGIWNAQLSNTEILMLSKGFTPPLVHPQSLLNYWPLYGTESPEPDRWKSRMNMSFVNTPTKDTHPPSVRGPENPH